MKKLITSKELAERWGVHPQTLKNWRQKKLGPRFVNIGRAVRYDLDEIEKFERVNQIKTFKKIS